MIENMKCKECEWLEIHEGIYICGCVAELYHIAKKVDPDEICKEEGARCRLK